MLDTPRLTPLIEWMIARGLHVTSKFVCELHLIVCLDLDNWEWAAVFKHF